MHKIKLMIWTSLMMTVIKFAKLYFVKGMIFTDGSQVSQNKSKFFFSKIIFALKFLCLLLELCLQSLTEWRKNRTGDVEMKFFFWLFSSFWFLWKLTKSWKSEGSSMLLCLSINKIQPKWSLWDRERATDW